jgi:hypothetical protein
MEQIQKGTTWTDPAITYCASHDGVGLHLQLSVDDDGYVTDFRIMNIR